MGPESWPWVGNSIAVGGSESEEVPMGSEPMEGLRSRSPDQLASGSFLTMAQKSTPSESTVFKSIHGMLWPEDAKSLISVKLGCRIASFRSWWTSILCETSTCLAYLPSMLLPIPILAAWESTSRQLHKPEVRTPLSWAQNCHSALHSTVLVCFKGITAVSHTHNYWIQQFPGFMLY